MLNGKTVLITGARGGIGQALMHAFAKQGTNILAHARSESEEFCLILEQIRTAYAIHVEPVYFDVTETVYMRNVLKPFILGGRSIDVLVNAAGIAHGGLFQALPLTKLREVFEINLFSCMEITQLVLRSMVRKKSGAVINIASIAGQDLHAGNSAYGVSKAAVQAWTQTLAAEVAPLGVRVNAIAPGLTDTGMAKLMGEKSGAAMVENSAMKRLARPEEIAAAAVFLASGDASFINGQTLRIDGGHI